jgi:hypothetical protein
MAAPASETPVTLLSRNYRIAHQRVLESADRTDDADFRRSLGISIHSVAWQVWHIARWDDRFAAFMAALTPEIGRQLGSTGEIWTNESLGARWGLPVGHMGRLDTGTDLDDDSADRLALPEKATIIAYARQVFGRVDEIVAALPPDRLFSVLPGDPDGDTYAQNVVIYLEHVARHLGMIEAIRGLQGSRGTASN